MGENGAVELAVLVIAAADQGADGARPVERDQRALGDAVFRRPAC